MAHAENHGHSVASWTGVVIELVASVLITLSLIMREGWMLVAGLALAVVGLVAWRLLVAAGKGDARTQGPLIEGVE